MKALFLPFFLFISAAWGAEKGVLPRFVSLKSSEVNVRVGPGPDYPIEWTYGKEGLPVEIIAEFDNWRQIRDQAGDKGWVHKNLLQGKRHGLIQGEEATLYARETSDSPSLAQLQQGVVVEVLKCRKEWCYVSIQGIKGWVKRSTLWGLYSDEVFG